MKAGTPALPKGSGEVPLLALLFVHKKMPANIRLTAVRTLQPHHHAAQHSLLSLVTPTAAYQTVLPRCSTHRYTEGAASSGQLHHVPRHAQPSLDR